MSGPEDLDIAIELYHQSADQIVKGDAEPMKAAFSHEDDVSLANPWGPFVSGWKQVADTLERAATHYRDGRTTGFEAIARYETSDLACIAQVERFEAKVGGSDVMTPIAIRVTSVLRLEPGGWKVVNRHADPIMSAQSDDSIIQK
jgi:ketosteroid isomerase-like protein